MSYRMKITLPDPIMAQLEALAEQRGEPASRIAAQMVCAGLAEGKDPRRDDSSITASSPATAPDRNAPWIEPVLGDPEWRSYMWGSIVALVRPLPARAGAPERRLVGGRRARRGALRARGLARLDRPGGGGPTARAGVSCAALRLQPRTPPGRRRRHAGMAARRPAGRVGSLIPGRDANERQHRGDARVGGRGRARTTGTANDGVVAAGWPLLRAPEASGLTP